MYKHNKVEDFVEEWQRLHQQTDAAVLQLIASTVAQHADALASLFYQHMLADQVARPFLDHELVNQRLHRSMQQWLCDLFAATPRDAAELYRHQCHVGAVHARIQIPVSLVMRGARLLKQAITTHLVDSQLDRSGLVQAARFISETMELSLSAMTDSYILSLGKNVRADESYRMFALGQNLLAERERQRAALLEWAQHLLLQLLSGEHDELPPIRHSEFGMWLQHKASIIFHDAPELERIRLCIDTLEQRLVPAVHQARRAQGDTREPLRQIEANIAEMKFLLTGLFDRVLEVESGRDSLTRLLNRRYLPTILMREVTFARRNGTPFAVLLLDIDHFKRINDSYGHASGDMVLQQAADRVSASVRIGDFVFRYGGEELLIVLVEVTPAQARQVAENIRERFQAEPFRISDEASIPVSVSIGIASYGGHPDYEKVIGDADDALYRAKENGRNRCEAAA